jgi:ABC-type branched-subunit amino acid transport system permease subunit
VAANRRDGEAEPGEAGLEVNTFVIPARSAGMTDPSRRFHRSMSLGAWTELIASGLITGGIYALVALGLNLQYGLMRILNIAHGEFLMLGAYLTWMMQAASASRRC